MAPFFVFRCKNNRGVNELTCLINKCAYMKHAGDDQALGLPSLNTRKSKKTIIRVLRNLNVQAGVLRWKPGHCGIIKFSYHFSST